MLITWFIWGILIMEENRSQHCMTINHDMTILPKKDLEIVRFYLTCWILENQKLSCLKNQRLFQQLFLDNYRSHNCEDSVKLSVLQYQQHNISLPFLRTKQCYLQCHKVRQLQQHHHQKHLYICEQYVLQFLQEWQKTNYLHQ